MELTKITNIKNLLEWVSSLYEYELQFNSVNDIFSKYGIEDGYRLIEEFYEEYNLDVWMIEENTIYVSEHYTIED